MRRSADVAIGDPAAAWGSCTEAVRAALVRMFGPEDVSERFWIPDDYAAFMTINGGGWEREPGPQTLFHAKAVAENSNHQTASILDHIGHELTWDNGFWLIIGKDYYGWIMLGCDRSHSLFGAVVCGYAYSHPYWDGAPSPGCRVAAPSFLEHLQRWGGFSPPEELPEPESVEEPKPFPFDDLNEHRFSSDKSRRMLAGPNGDVARILNHNFNHSKKVRGLTSVSECLYAEAVYCVLAGLDDLADVVLRKAQTWITAALEIPEDPNGAFFGHPQGKQRNALASINWLLENRHDGDNLGQTVELHEQWLATCPEEDREGPLIVLLFTCLDARDYVRIARIGDEHNVYPPPPADQLKDAGTLTPMTVCRVLSHHKLGRGYTDEDISTMLVAFTRRYVRLWLENLNLERLAWWMKVLHWRGEDAAQSAKEAVRLALRWYSGFRLETAAARFARPGHHSERGSVTR
jgi:hypothetical protein